MDWKGYTWTKRPTGGGPMYNGQWLTANVTDPDGSDYIKLKISNASGTSPSGAEIYTTGETFGYGTYTYVLGTQVNTMNKAVVVGGLFLYDSDLLPHHNEIDVGEISAWGGGPTNTNPVELGQVSWYNAAGVGVSQASSVNMTADPVTTHRVIWGRDKLVFEAFAGVGTSGTLIHRTVQTENIPTPAAEQAHFNIWVFDSADVGSADPSTVPETEITLRDFTFEPLDYLYPSASQVEFTPIPSEALPQSATEYYVSVRTRDAAKGDRWSDFTTSKYFYVSSISTTSITKSLTYRVELPLTITKSLKYTIEKAVTVTKSLAYSIEKSASLTKSLKYAVKSPVTATKSLRYAVRVTAAAATKSLTYKVKAGAAAITKSLKYSMKPSVTVTKSLKYSVEAPATVTKSLKYTIEKAVTVTKSLKYTVEAPATVTKSLKYCIETSQTATKSLTYRVEVASSLTKTLKYAVETAVTVTKSLTYNISALSTVTITKSLRYALDLGSTTLTKSLRYAIEANPTLTKSLKYTVEKANTVTKSLVYAIEQPLTVTKSLKYAVKSPVTITKGLTYRVETNTTTQKTLKYTIEKALTVTKSLRYAIDLGTFTIQKSLRYAIEKTYSATKSLTYRVETAPSITKSLRYAIEKPITVSKSLKYTVEVQASLTKTLKYAVETTKTLQKSLTYRTVTEPAKQLSLSYMVRVTHEPISHSLTYQVETLSTLQKSLTYDIVRELSEVKALTYSLKTTTSLTLGLTYVALPPYVESPYSEFCDNPYSKMTSPFSELESPYEAWRNSSKVCPVHVIVSVPMTYSVLVLPEVTTNATSSITTVDAQLNGTIVEAGNRDIEERGFVMDTSSQSQPGDVAPASSGYASVYSVTGSFTEGAYSITAAGLTHSTRYYARAFVRTGEDRYVYSSVEVNFLMLSNQSGGGPI